MEKTHFVFAPDMSASVAWYTALLGHAPDPDTRRTRYRLPHGELVLTTYGRRGQHQLAVGLDSLDEVHLAGAGGTARGCVDCRDPAGNRVLLVQRPRRPEKRLQRLFSSFLLFSLPMAMNNVTHILHSPLLGLLPLAAVAWYGWKLARTPAPAFAATGPFVALLLLGQLPLLLVLRLALPRSEASTLGLLLLGGCVFVLHRLLPVLGHIPTPARWRPWLLGLAGADAAAVLILLARPQLALPGWTGGLALLAGGAGLVSLLAGVRRSAAGREAQPPGRSHPVPVHFATVAEARKAYYRQAKALTPGLVEYLCWFHTLPADRRPAARLAGPGGAWTDRRFRRSFRLFVLEHRGCSYVNFMAEHLDADQFVRWVNLLQLAPPDDASPAHAWRR